MQSVGICEMKNQGDEDKMLFIQTLCKHLPNPRHPANIEQTEPSTLHLPSKNNSEYRLPPLRPDVSTIIRCLFQSFNLHNQASHNLFHRLAEARDRQSKSREVRL